MTRKWISMCVGLLWATLGAEAGTGKVWADPQDQQQKPAYTLAEYNVFKAADAEQNPQEKIKQLDDFVKQFPDSTLMPYIYRDYYQTDYALKNFDGTIENADRVVVLSDKVGTQWRLEALVARAQAYDAGANHNSLTAFKARDAAALGLKTLQDWKKPDAMAKNQYTQQVKRYKALFNTVYSSASVDYQISSEVEGAKLRQEMTDRRALELKQQDEEIKAQGQVKVKQAEFEQRKKEAVELGMKPGTAEYIEYVATGKVSSTAAQGTRQATVHITSSPSSGEIYVDGKFVGNTPSDITIAAGEHAVKITIGGKEWSRSIQITSGEVSLHAEIPTERQP
jgi:hypothetical protein